MKLLLVLIFLFAFILKRLWVNSNVRGYTSGTVE